MPLLISQRATPARTSPPACPRLADAEAYTEMLQQQRKTSRLRVCLHGPRLLSHLVCIKSTGKNRKIDACCPSFMLLQHGKKEKTNVVSPRKPKRPSKSKHKTPLATHVQLSSSECASCSTPFAALRRKDFELGQAERVICGKNKKKAGKLSPSLPSQGLSSKVLRPFRRCTLPARHSFNPKYPLTPPRPQQAEERASLKHHHHAYKKKSV